MSSLLPPGCRKFSERILIWEPTEDPQIKKKDGFSKALELENDQSPEIVLLFTWADAQPRHYVKYIEGYQNLYPQAKIILTTATTLGTFFGGQEAAQKIVSGMVHRELAPLYASNSQDRESLVPRRRMLVHAFSNSGGLNFEAVWSVWKQIFGCSAALPVTALVLDSTPGGLTYHTEFRRWTTGVALGFGKALPSFLSRIIAAIIVTCLMVAPQILGIEIMATRGPRELNSPHNIPCESTRLYIYSTSDCLINYRDVERHAAAAKEKGYHNTILERFDGSMHVSHLKLDPSRYWNAVWKMWNMACRNENFEKHETVLE